MDLGNRAPSAGSDSDAVSAKLDAMMARMEAMQAQFDEVGDKVDGLAAARNEQFGALATKLDQLLLKENEQIFTFFMMKPLPAKGRMGKALAMMKPKNWLTHPMLLVPLYKDKSGEKHSSLLSPSHR